MTKMKPLHIVLAAVGAVATVAVLYEVLKPKAVQAAPTPPNVFPSFPNGIPPLPFPIPVPQPLPGPGPAPAPGPFPIIPPQMVVVANAMPPGSSIAARVGDTLSVQLPGGPQTLANPGGWSIAGAPGMLQQHAGDPAAFLITGRGIAQVLSGANPANPLIATITVL